MTRRRWSGWSLGVLDVSPVRWALRDLRELAAMAAAEAGWMLVAVARRVPAVDRRVRASMIRGYRR